jgi:hypothetical protein
MTVVFGSGKPQLEASGDLRVASELNSLKIHLMQTRSWTITLLVNSRVICEWSTGYTNCLEKKNHVVLRVVDAYDVPTPASDWTPTTSSPVASGLRRAIGLITTSPP